MAYRKIYYWNLPDGHRAELIDGQLYDMAPSGRIHQRIIIRLSALLLEHIQKNNSSCDIYPAPFAVNLNADDKTYAEPDISVICDPQKLSDRGCEGAPIIFFFDQAVTVGIYKNLVITIADLLK